jgi:ferredoxin
MAYLVIDNCVKCKHTDCVEVCPVDCFYEGENFLAINPDECIDCGVCEPECPVDAIVPDNALEGEELEKWMDINTKYSLIWPVITQKKDALPEAEEFNGVPNKFEQYFSENPGEGDD